MQQEEARGTANGSLSKITVVPKLSVFRNPVIFFPTPFR